MESKSFCETCSGFCEALFKRTTQLFTISSLISDLVQAEPRIDREALHGAILRNRNALRKCERLREHLQKHRQSAHPIFEERLSHGLQQLTDLRLEGRLLLHVTAASANFTSPS
jgi:hypothetical protein